jgi:D-amino peptidase
MKVYLSVDMEGVTGAQHWDETEIGKPGYERLRDRMAREAATVAAAALEAGAREVWVQDAHDTGRNLAPEDLPPGCRLIRGWSGDPRLMVQELDKSFAALLVVGWHSGAGSGGSPLCHAMSTGLTGLRLNGEPCSELRLAGLTAAGLGVPLVFCAGDQALCAEARAWLPGIRTVATQEGRGESVVCHDAQAVLARMAEAGRAALANLSAARLPRLPRRWELEMDFRSPARARRASFYPGMRQVTPSTVRLRGGALDDLLRALLFAV